MFEKCVAKSKQCKKPLPAWFGKPRKAQKDGGKRRPSSHSGKPLWKQQSFLNSPDFLLLTGGVRALGGTTYTVVMSDEDGVAKEISERV